MANTQSGEAKTRRLKRRATVIFRRGDRILFVRKHDAKWNLPGGRVEANETPAQAAYREMAEETGLTLGHLFYLSEYRDSEVIHYLFESSVALPGEPVPCNEIEACRWFKAKDLSKRNVAKAVKTMVKRWAGQ